MIESDSGRAGHAFRMPGATGWREITVSEDSDQLDKEEVGRAKEELKNMLLTSLKMENLVVLAGSGCSLAAGGPSMNDLWVDAVGDEPTADAVDVAQKVNQDIDDENIEGFLSRVESFLQLHEDDKVADFLKSSKRVILNKCRGFLNVSRLGAHKTFLHRLSRRRARDQRLRVFTTNYDLCFERAAAELGGVALDGFSFTVPRRYDPRFFDYDIIRRPNRGEDSGSYLEGVFLLYKLHGSVNWDRASDGVIYEADAPEPENACLIYPAVGKYQQSFMQPHLESMARYLSTVREPNTCVLAVGFGFNDEHLAEPLLSAVQSNPHLRLIVADPGSKEKIEKGDLYWKEFSELSYQGEDVWFVNASFGDFSDMIPDLKSLTPADNLMKAIRGVTKGV